MDSNCALEKHLDNRCEIATTKTNRIDSPSNSPQPEYLTSRWAVCPECGKNLFPKSTDQVQTNEDADRYDIGYTLCKHLTTTSKDVRTAMRSFLSHLKTQSTPRHRLALRLLKRPDKEQTTCSYWVVESMMKVAFHPSFYQLSGILRTHFHLRMKPMKPMKRKTSSGNETLLKKSRSSASSNCEPPGINVVYPLALPPSGGGSGGPEGYCAPPQSFGQPPEADGSVGRAGVSDDQTVEIKAPGFSFGSVDQPEEPLPALFEGTSVPGGVTQGEEAFFLPYVARPLSPDLHFGSENGF